MVTHDYGNGPVRVWYSFEIKRTNDHNGPLTRYLTMGEGPLEAVRRINRAFPPRAVERLAFVSWNRYAPCVRPTGC